MSTLDDGDGACPGTVTLDDFVDGIPTDPLDVAPNIYRYEVDGTGSSYSVQAVLERSDAVLYNDSEATGLGVLTCDDAANEYCIGR